MSLASEERAALCDLLDEVGPDADTLCAGWTTRDLVAHMVVRESRPDASLGIVVPPLRRWTSHIQERTSHQDFEHLVDRVRGGPPRWSGFNLPGVDANANAFEYLVHHEDVRRAVEDWAPRELPEKLTESMWAALEKRGGKYLFRKTSSGVILQRPDGRSFIARSGEPAVTIVGEPVELILYGYGRAAHAQVEVLGEPDVLAQFKGESFAV